MKNKKAFDFLSKRQIHKAQECFSLAYFKNPKNTEAQMGLLLCDIALHNFDHASALVEYYFVLLSEAPPSEAQTRIFDLIASYDKKENLMFENLYHLNQSKIESLEGISYEDFKNFVLTKPNFKEAFEDLTFSTKIVFSNRRDLYDFLNLLIENDCANISLGYIENLQENLDPILNQILQKAVKYSK